MKITVFWDVTPCGLVDSCFRGIYPMSSQQKKYKRYESKDRSAWTWGLEWICFEMGHYDIEDLLQDWELEMLTLSPCSHDILPCDFVLFIYVKKPLRECRFECIDTVSTAIMGFECSLSVGGCRAAGDQLPHGWEKCKELGEECVE